MTAPTRRYPTRQDPVEPDLAALGARLRSLRVEAGWNQTEVGYLFETGPNRISDWEFGMYAPSLSVLRKFAEAFDTTVSALLEGIM